MAFPANVRFVAVCLFFCTYPTHVQADATDNGCENGASSLCSSDVDENVLMQLPLRVHAARLGVVRENATNEDVEDTDGGEVKEPAATVIDRALHGAGSTRTESKANIIKKLNRALASQTPQQAEHNGDLVTGRDFASIVGERGEDIGCTSCFQGDMVAASAEQLALFQDVASGKQRRGSGGTPWTAGAVKYCVAADIDQEILTLWNMAMQQVQSAVHGITFEDVGNSAGHTSTSTDTDKACDSAPAIFLQSNPSSGCWTFVGEMPSPFNWGTNGEILSMQAQLLNLKPDGCALLGTVLHELLHCLGMHHEQSRPDRDTYVTIHWDNLKKGVENNFFVEEEGHTGLDYDYLSVMHYDTDAFSENGLPTITTSGGSHDSEIGQRVGLAQSDADQLADMYGLNASQLEAHTGCRDTDSVCSSLSGCETRHHMDACCGCGGGLTHRCWSGAECETPAELPQTLKMCLKDRTADFGGRYDCVIQHKCNYNVKVSCVNVTTTGSKHTTSYVSHTNGRNYLPPSSWPRADVCGLVDPDSDGTMLFNDGKSYDCSFLKV